MPNILSKKIVFVVILSAVLISTAGSASAGFLDFIKERSLFIWPVPRTFDINITSPNGGERWVKGETYSITWDINDVVIQEWLDKFEPKDSRVSNGLYPIRNLDLLVFLINDRYPITTAPQIVTDQIRGFYPHPSSVFLGRANIHDQQMNWNISKSIPVGDGYKVRLVAVWGVINNVDSTQGINRLPYAISDESDRPFSIVNPRPIPTPTPAPIDVEELLRQIEQMRRELNIIKQSFNRMDSILVKMEHIIRILIGR